MISTRSLTTTSLDDLLDLQREAEDHPLARTYVDRVVATVLPTRDEEPPGYADLAATVREHCRQRGYTVSDGARDRFGYRTWQIEVASHEGRVQLALNGEVVLLSFTGGFTWPSSPTNPRMPLTRSRTSCACWTPTPTLPLGPSRPSGS